MEADSRPEREQVDSPGLARRLQGLPRRNVLGYEVVIADTYMSRLLGLALLSRGQAGSGLLLRRCRSIHTFGMRFPLDLVFLDQEGRPLSAHESVPPSRFAREPAARSVLELPSR
jgi:uncharacterized membrane protein (UPF0127 family)